MKAGNMGEIQRRIDIFKEIGVLKEEGPQRNTFQGRTCEWG